MSVKLLKNFSQNFGGRINEHKKPLFVKNPDDLPEVFFFGKLDKNSFLISETGWKVYYKNTHNADNYVYVSRNNNSLMYELNWSKQKSWFTRTIDENYEFKIL